MTVLTATNERVQAYLNKADKPTTKAKENRLEMFKVLLQKAGQFVTELFPRKQGAVLDEIMYLTAAAGIAKIGADKLAKRAGVSERTVSTVVSKLKENGYIVARINSGQAGKYIFVDTCHANYADIMRTVFNKDATQLASQNATQLASLENAETLDAVSVDSEKEPPISNNLNNSFNNKTYTNITNTTAASANELLREGLLSKLPVALANVIKPFFSTADEIYEISGTIFKAKNKNVRIEDHEPLFRKAILSVINSWKRAEKSGKLFNVYAVMFKAIRELSKKIVDGTVYPTPKSNEVKSCSQVKVDVFAQQKALQEAAAQRKSKEALPAWFKLPHER